MLLLQSYFFVTNLYFKKMVSPLSKKYTMDNNTIRAKILELFKNDSLTNTQTQTLLSAVDTEKCVDLTLALYKKDLLTLEECDAFLRHFETLNMGRLFVKNLEKSRETIFKIFPNTTPYSPYIPDPYMPPFKVTF